jgi:riboflavin synthase
MFTGLIKDIGKVVQIKPNAEGKEIIIETNKLSSEIAIDDSVATNGVCLTATKIKGNQFTVQAVHVTLEKTSIGDLKVGSLVNLELALRPIDRLGGHIVQGHVNGLGKVKSIKALGKNYEIELSARPDLFKYIIKEGSIALDGISLTIARLTDTSLTVSIIPHTYENTTLHSKKIGDSVNIEVDMMAKYLENFLRFEKKDQNLMNLLGQ